MKVKQAQPVICVVGLGYVGLPLAEAFSEHYDVYGFDNNCARIVELQSRSGNHAKLVCTDSPEAISKANFVIITVPTPVNKSKEPDLSYVIDATRTVSHYIRPGCLIILESTVYPGVTENVVKPILEESGLKFGRDFNIGYSPERINPGDEEHSINKIVKVVSSTDEESTEIVASLYRTICPEVFKAKNIMTAEAAKIIENVQRDINIALVNELSIIFGRMGLNTNEVLQAAATKWNFSLYKPGFVGGHCIPVDPYYLVYKARELDYHPQVILAGRAINDHMPKYVADLTIKELNNAGKVIKGSRVLIMGLTYKANVPDTRETPAHDMTKELKEYGVQVYGHDPFLKNIDQEFGITGVEDISTLEHMDCLILCNSHEKFHSLGLKELRTIMNSEPIIIDICRLFNETEAVSMGFHYRSL